VDIDAQLRAAAERFNAGDLSAAKTACDAVIAYAPRQPVALNLLALIARQIKKWGKAEEIAKAGLAANPDDPNLANTLGVVMLDQRRWQDAEEAFSRAVEIDPISPLFLSNLGRAVLRQGRQSQAREYFDRAVASDASFIPALTGRAEVSLEVGDLDAADKDLESARAIEPNSPDVLGAQAVLELARGNLDGAYRLFDEVSSTAPDGADAAVNRGLVRLMQGNVAEGWDDYTLRRKRRWARAFGRHETLPQWTGGSLAGKSLLVWCEQGLGEAILGASQLAGVIAEADSVTVECDTRLTDIFARSFPDAHFLHQSDPPHAKIHDGAFDCQAAMFDLIGARAQGIAQQAPLAPYLRADASAASDLRNKYLGETRRNVLVGLSWGSPKALSAGQKGLAPEAWLPVFGADTAAFVNLQYGAIRAAMAAIAETAGAVWVDDSNVDPDGPLDGFASQIAALDLVITVSNTTAHLAGALGVETWVLVPPPGPASMWYWFTDRTDSPWYQSVRLFRRRPGQRDAAHLELRSALDVWLSQRSG
jgi:Tfp pilus assembly protein PilF